MKNKFKLILSMLVLCLTFLVGSMAMAAEEADIYEVKGDKETFIVAIVYEKDDVSISFLDPDKKEVKLTDSNVVCTKSDGGMFVTIQDAKKGQWKLVYDKGSNDKISVSAQKYEENFWIEDLTIGQINADCKLPVSFTATGNEKQRYNYEISIGAGEGMTGEQVIYSASATVGDKIEKEVDLSKIPSYKNYRIKVFAAYEEDGVTYFDEAITDEFEYTNTVNGEKEAFDKYEVEIDKNAKTVRVDFGKTKPWDASGVYVTFAADGTNLSEEVVDFSGDVYAAFVHYSEGAKEIEITVTLKYNNGSLTKPSVKKISLDGADGSFAIKTKQASAQKSDRFEIEYLNAKDNEIIVTINGEEKKEALNGSGTTSVKLKSDQNSISIQYSPYDDVVFVENAVVVVDNVAPELIVYENLDGTFTSDDSISIAGRTEAGAEVTVNGNKIEIDNDGSFLSKFDLKDGANKIQIVAKDEVGNESVYAITVNRGTKAEAAANKKDEKDTGIWKYIPLFVALLISLFVAIELVIIAKAKKAGGEKIKVLKKLDIVFLVCSSIGLVASIVVLIHRAGKASGKAFIDLAAKSPVEAHELLEAKSTALHLMIMCIVLVVLAIAGLVAIILYGKSNTPEKKALREEKRKAKEAARAAAKAEAERQAELARQAEEARQAELAKQAEIERAEAEKRQAEYAKRMEAERAEAEKRQAEYAKRMEAERAEAEKQAAAKLVDVPKAKKFCTGCGNQLDANAKFCTRCGTRCE